MMPAVRIRYILYFLCAVVAGSYILYYIPLFSVSHFKKLKNYLKFLTRQSTLYDCLSVNFIMLTELIAEDKRRIFDLVRDL